MAHGPMSPEDRAAYIAYLEDLREKFFQGVQLMDDNDKLYILDKIEDSRWLVGSSYNKGVHILMDVVQLAVEASYASPNIRNVK